MLQAPDYIRQLPLESAIVHTTWACQKWGQLSGYQRALIDDLAGPTIDRACVGGHVTRYDLPTLPRDTRRRTTRSLQRLGMVDNNKCLTVAALVAAYWRPGSPWWTES